jgi:hypothetical protein
MMSYSSVCCEQLISKKYLATFIEQEPIISTIIDKSVEISNYLNAILNSKTDKV